MSTELEAELAATKGELALHQQAFEEIARVCTAAARGILEPRITNTEHFGELGAPLRSLNSLLDLTDAFVREAGAALSHAADGRFYRRFLEHGMLGCFRNGARQINAATDVMAENRAQLDAAAKERLALADGFEATVAAIVTDVASAADGMRTSAQHLSGLAEETTGQSTTVAAASEQTSQNMNTIASATEEISATVGEIERQVQESREIARSATEQARRTDEVVRGLDAASERICDVVGLISRVASQTRLLALNATIEAVHAGDAGRGFSVVASEVKDLAAQTASATDEIERQVAEIRDATGGAMTAIQDIGRTVEEMSMISSGITDSVTEQRLATLDISRSVSEAASGTGEVSRSIAHVSTSAQETSDAATSLLTAAGGLTDLSSRLGDTVVGFLEQVRGG